MSHPVPSCFSCCCLLCHAHSSSKPIWSEDTIKYRTNGETLVIRENNSPNFKFMLQATNLSPLSSFADEICKTYNLSLYVIIQPIGVITDEGHSARKCNL